MNQPIKTNRAAVFLFRKQFGKKLREGRRRRGRRRRGRSGRGWRRAPDLIPRIPLRPPAPARQSPPPDTHSPKSPPTQKHRTPTAPPAPRPSRRASRQTTQCPVASRPPHRTTNTAFRKKHPRAPRIARRIVGIRFSAPRRACAKDCGCRRARAGRQCFG